MEESPPAQAYSHPLDQEEASEQNVIMPLTPHVILPVDCSLTF